MSNAENGDKFELKLAQKVLEKEIIRTSHIEYNMGLVYQMQGKLDNALSSYDKCLKMSHNNDNCLLNSGVIYENYKKFTKASEMYSLCFMQNMKCRFNLARMKYRVGNFVQTISLLPKTFGHLSPKEIASFLNLVAIAYFNIGETELAINFAKSSLSYNANHTPALNFLQNIAKVEA